jgi:YidC/Oxa1 family membrane protein insertase
MDNKKIILYALLALIIYSLWSSWQKDFPATPSTVNAPQTVVTDSGLLPQVSGQNNAAINMGFKSNPQKLIRVKTDVVDVTIDTTQGDIVKTELPHYPVSVEESNTPITLLNDNPDKRYVANSSLFTNVDNQVKNVNFNFRTAHKEYVLGPEQKQLSVVLEGQSDTGLQVRKTFIFTPGSYLIQMNYEITNNATTNWDGYLNMQLLRTSPEEDSSSMFHVGSYTGASYANPGKNRYKKVSFKDMTKGNLNAEVKGGWVAMQQHYFLSAWIPPADSQYTLYTRAIDKDFTIGAVSKPLVLAPGQTKQLTNNLYIGPEDTAVLGQIAPGLDMTVDYGFLWVISAPLFSLMKLIYSFVGNWGWSIVLVTLLIKLAFYRLSARSYKSMAGMRKLQPKLQALKDRYGDDKAKLSQATMELYKQEKVNPLGGCLPILVQIPVFIALYWVLLESVELRQAPFIFWIKDLSAPDPYHFLPIIMGATMLIQQRLNPAPPDPVQAKMMMFLPIMFTALFWNFPSGLVLYWIVNNTLSILQQWYITRKYGDDKPANTKRLASAK